jgi:hypothetical protein
MEKDGERCQSLPGPDYSRRGWPRMPNLLKHEYAAVSSHKHRTKHSFRGVRPDDVGLSLAAPHTTASSMHPFEKSICSFFFLTERDVIAAERARGLICFVITACWSKPTVREIRCRKCGLLAGNAILSSYRLGWVWVGELCSCRGRAR